MLMGMDLDQRTWLAYPDSGPPVWVWATDAEAARAAVRANPIFAFAAVGILPMTDVPLVEMARASKRGRADQQTERVPTMYEAFTLAGERPPNFNQANVVQPPATAKKAG